MPSADRAAATAMGDEPAQALLQAWAASRDERAFDALVTRYAPMVRATCRRVLQDAAQAEDATQETFLQLSRHAARIHSNTGGWLMATARTTAIDLLQQNRARRRRERHAASDQELTTPETAGAELGTAENLAQLDQAMLGLSEAERGVLIDYFWSGRTQEDIGREAGVSQVAIKKRIDRALENLRTRMKRFSPAALLLLLAAATPSAEPAGEAALLARLHALDLRTDPSAPSRVRGLIGATIVAVLLLVAARAVSWTGGQDPIRTVPPPSPVAVQPWSDGWTITDIAVEPISAESMRLDPGVQQYGHMIRPIGRDGVEVAIVVEKRHCPFFGLAILPSDGTRPLMPLSIVPDPKAPDAGCWTRESGEHRLSLRLEQDDGGSWVVCTIDGEEGLRQRMAGTPTHAMVVVCSGQVLLKRAEPLQKSTF